MTTIATICGTIPLALSKGEGSETWVPLGVTLLGGLAVSTLITLLLVPAMYTIAGETLRSGHEAGGHHP